MTDETIFATALEKADPAARTAFLAEACGGDPERRKRVERLLAAHDKASNFLEHPAVGPHDPETANTRTFGPDGPAAAEDDEVPLAFLAPAGRPDSLGRIGHYEVLQVLGQGGFGIVFRAFDEVLHRVVAVKVLAPQMASTSPARKRFIREARSSAAVRHENVVQVYEVGETPLPYLVMEFIPGETLQQRLDRTGPLDVAEVVRIGRQIAEGLAAAHATDLIHRDIKPGNILLEGGAQRVKITDFGLARAADDASLSQSGLIAGTPMYMAPEQAKGEHIDQRADLFSLGSVLYQMAAGRPPFRATGTLAVLKRVAEDDPRPIREIIPETPQWLCDIIAKLHAKNPADRYQSAREVADVLADCEAQLHANGKVRTVVHLPAVRPAAGRSGRRKWVAAAALMVAVLVAWGVYALTRPADPLANDTAPVADSPKTAVTSWGAVIDPLGDCTVSEANGRLTLRVPGDGRHDLNPTPGWNLNAPRVLRDLEGDFDVTATVFPFPRPVAGTNARPDGTCYVGAGLVVLAGEGSVLRLFRTGLHSNRDGAPYAEAEWFVGGARQQKAVYVSDSACHLRIQRTGSELRLSHSADGRQWSHLWTVTDLPLGERVRVGAAAVSSLKQEFEASLKLEALNSSGPLVAVAPFDAAKAKYYQDAWAKHLGVEVETTNSIGMAFRLVPPGEFRMGSSPEEIATFLASEREPSKFLVNAEGPQRTVRLSTAYYMGTFEVTQAEYARVAGTNPSDFAKTGKAAAKVEGLDTDRFPVENVNWDEAVAFCHKLSELPAERAAGRAYRLATEAQWEFACRAGTVSRFATGDELKAGDANINKAVGRPEAVGSFRANAFGLHDMHGNVFEWCQDWFATDYRDQPTLDPQGPATGQARVVRGADYAYLDRYCRSASRDRFQPPTRRGGIGFRVAIVGPPKPAPVPTAPVVPQANADPDPTFFTGKDLGGWVGDTDNFVAAGQTLLGALRGPANKTVYRDKAYRDFELSFAAKFKGGTGSLALSFRAAGEARGESAKLTGPLVHFSPTAWGKIEVPGKGANGRFTLAEGTLTGVTLDGFNDVRVRCVGKKVTVHINNAVAAEVEHEGLPDEGVIGLRLGSGTSQLTLRDLRLVDLSPRPPAPAVGGWVAVKPAEPKSEGGVTLKVLDDGSVLASGKLPDQDVYTLTLTGLPAKVHGLRLDALLHDSLPKTGPGRDGDGRFVLTTIKAQLESPKKAAAPVALIFAKAWDDGGSGDDSRPHHAIDEEDTTGWATEPGKPHFAVFVLGEPIDVPDGGVLRVTLEFKHDGVSTQLGCFRLSVAADKAAVEQKGDEAKK